MAHAKLSPSARHRWGACPGSVREESKFPPSPSGPAAIDGTHSHTLLEKCIVEELNPLYLIGQKLQDYEGEFEVDRQRAERVQVALDYIGKVEDAHDGGASVQSEVMVNPGTALLTHRDDLSGTVDVLIYAPGQLLEIIDYKDGINPVEAKGNAQMEQYLVGAVAHLDDTPAVFRMTIIQPKLAVLGKPPISSHDLTTEDISKIAKRLEDQAAATDDPNAPLVPGESQCRYCRAKGSCSALANEVMKEVGVMFQPVQDISQQSANKDPATMDDAQLRQIMEAAPLMRQMLDAVEAEAQRRLEAGQSIPGLKLVNGRGSRAWSLPEDQIAEKLVKMGIPKSAVYETKLVSPAKAEKLRWKKRSGEEVSLSDRQLKLMETEYVVKMGGKLTVAFESDSRPAVTMNAAPLFSAIEAAPAAESLPSWLM